MNDTTMTLLDKLIMKNVRLFNLKLRRRKENPFILKEEYHLSTRIQNDLFSWGLQQSIGITKNGKIHMWMFLHPIIINDSNRTAFIEFANAENLWLASELGRFWVNAGNVTRRFSI